jgi:predicted PurR-regulated permease PerM
MMAAAVVVVAGLRAAGPILIPVLLAVFLAFVGSPILQWLCRKGVRLSLAVFVTVLVEFGLLTILGLLMSTTFNEFARAAPGYLNALITKMRDLVALLPARGVDLSEYISLERLDPSSLMDLAGGIVGGTVKGVASLFSHVTLVLIILIFVLVELAALPEKLKRVQGGDRLTEYVQVIMTDIQRYLGVKTLMSLAVGAVVGLWVWFLDIPFPLFWAALAFLLHYIPAIGAFLAGIPAILVALVQQGFGTALVLALGFVAINVVLGNFVEPLLMGHRFGLSTLVVFLSLMFWGWIWGPVGMLLSIPLTMIIKIMLVQSDGLGWLALLMGPSAPMAAEAARHRQAGEET